MAREKAEEPTDTDQFVPVSEVEVCKLCEEEVEKRHLGHHLWTRHLGMTLPEYGTWFPGKPRAQFIELGEVRLLPSVPPESSPEPELIFEVRLADVETNPDFESCQGRTPGPTYSFSKSRWTPVAAPDYWIIVGSKDIPSQCPYLAFETRKKRRGKKKAGKGGNK